jgi:hypothetical protein
MVHDPNMTTTTPVEHPWYGTWDYDGQYHRKRIASQPSRPPMDADPHTHPATADSDADTPAVAPVPDGHPPASDGDADSERIRPAATLADVDRLMGNVFERWRLIQDLAAIEPKRWYGQCFFCHYMDHRDDCLWVRANRLTNETDDQP